MAFSLGPSREPLVDGHGRTIRYLRVSVTDRCDLRCRYCMAEKMTFLPRRSLLALEEIAIIAKGRVAFDGRVDEARARLRPIVRLRTRASDGAWRSAIPAGARQDNAEWVFELPEEGPEPLLKALIDGGAGIDTLAIERPGLHDAFVAIAGAAAAAEMGHAR